MLLVEIFILVVSPTVVYCSHRKFRKFTILKGNSYKTPQEDFKVVMTWYVFNWKNMTEADIEAVLFK